MANSSSTDPGLRNRFFIFLALAVIAMLVMRYITHGLGSRSIIDFEMAKSTDRVMQLLTTWDSTYIERFINGIYADFGFIIGYAGALFFGARYLGQLSGHYILRKAGIIFSFFALFAGLFDVIENIGMLTTLYFRPIGWVVHFTYDMAVLKFSLVLIVILFMVICLLFWLLNIVSGQNKKFMV